MALANSVLDLWRLARRGAARPLTAAPADWALYLGAQVIAGLAVAGLVLGYAAFIRDGVAGAPADILHFGLRPWDWTRLSLLTGLVVLNVAVVALGVMCYRAALLSWAMSSLRRSGRAATAAAWMVGPVLLIGTASVGMPGPQWPAFLAATFIAAIAWRE